MTRRGLITLLTALAAAGCGDSTGTPTSPTDTSTPAPILFSGTLAPGGSRFYSYTLTNAGSVTAMLASLERGGVPVAAALELALGRPAGTDCAITTEATLTPSLVPQLRLDSAIGTYCVRIADTAGLGSPAAFTIRVVRP